MNYIHPILKETNPSLSTVLVAAERAGKLNLSITDIAAALPDISQDALRQAIYRQQIRGRIVPLSRGSGHWLIVPLQYALSGAPPLEIWLDRYLSKTIQLPYYVGLLSAAEIYGASPYAVMVTQVVVAKPRRPLTVGRHKLVFHVRVNTQQMPVRWHETVEGGFKVSTPELTALDLVRYESQIGGISRVRELLPILSESCTPDGMLEALDAAQEVPAAQRIGVLFSLQDSLRLALAVQRWLDARKLRAIPLESGTTTNEKNRLDPIFKVWLPIVMERANA